ncbi:MAG TPA: serine/threonine-protein kinase [Pirellulales bacterium]|nr:serine/threonine-protein kinase [Pirellulales bacterium]
MTVPKLDEHAIFNVARQIDAREARRLYLEQACGDDNYLFARVEALLRVYDEQQSFLQPTVHGRRGAVERPPTDEGPGTVIGPYKLLEQIGEGGMGVVFMAEQHEPVRRKVALKIIKPGMDTRQVVARFEAERQALSLMDHPNIAKVLDAGATSSGHPYFVMELVKGQPITNYCDEHHLTPRQRLELLLPVCQAIQHAHQKGIIHRDIKPSNILVAEYDQKAVPKVIDFGVAKATAAPLTERTMFTGFGQLVGTIEYMSPEQAKVNQLDVDTRTDIYSLGVLLYELLTGSTPFDRQRLRSAAWDEMLRIIREEEPQKPSTRLSSADTLPSIAANRSIEPARLSRTIRGELDWIAMKALEKDRSRRYETASGFALDLQRYLDDEPVQACPPSAAYRLRKFVRRNKGPVLAAAFVALSMVVGIIGPTWGMLRATHAESLAVYEANQKESALRQKEAALADAKDKMWLSLYEQARARRSTRQMGQRLKSLDALAKAAAVRTDERLRDEAIAAMALPDVLVRPDWHARVPIGQAFCLDARYRRLARVDDQGVISVRSFPDNCEIQSIVGVPIKSRPAWVGRFSPDGQYLATLELGNAPLRVWRVADGKAVLREELPPSLAIAFSPDSRQLAVGQQGWVIRFDLATGQELNRWQLPDKTPAYSLAFHPDKPRLAIGYHDPFGFVSVFDASNGELVTNLAAKVNYEQVVAWHPDGERLAIAGSDTSIQIWNVAAQRKVAQLEGHAQNVTFLSFHPDGNLLTSTSWDGTVRLWDPSTARQLMQLPMRMEPQFSSDGQSLGVAWRGEEGQMLDVSLSREYRTLVSSDGAGQSSYYSGDISPDGRLLALGMGSGTRLWDLASGRELARLPDASTDAFFDRHSERWDLLTSTTTGLYRWPARLAGSSIQLGPPVQLSPLYHAGFARSPEGRTLAAVIQFAGPIEILNLDQGTVRQKTGVHRSADGQVLSRDGRWLASRGWHSDRVRLWNAETGQAVHEWVVASHAHVYFTPDSRALIISDGNEFNFYDVETLQPLRTIPTEIAQFPGHVAFSTNGRLMALEMAPGVIHLKDAASARTVARLADPSGDRAGWICFTPDGTQIVVTVPYAHAVHIWDLRAIRQRLKGMGLDWDWPEFEQATPGPGADEPLKVEIVPGDPVPPAPLPDPPAPSGAPAALLDIGLRHRVETDLVGDRSTGIVTEQRKAEVITL